MKLELKNATINQVVFQPNEDGGKGILVIAAPMTLAIADAIGARNMIYNLNDNPNPFTALKLGTKQENVSVRVEPTIGNPITLTADRVASFGVAQDQDGAIELQLRAHFGGAAYAQHLLDFYLGTGKAEFSASIELAEEKQESLDLGQGEKVDMGSGKRIACSLCADGVPIEDDLHSLPNGEKRPCGAAIDEDGPALASAVEVAGTTAELKRKRKLFRLANPAPVVDAVETAPEA